MARTYRGTGLYKSVAECPECGSTVAQYNVSRNEMSMLVCEDCDEEMEPQ